MNEGSPPRDLVTNSDSMVLLWGLPTAIILLTGCCAGDSWVVTISWTLSLLVMGSACPVNARGILIACRKLSTKLFGLKLGLGLSSKVYRIHSLTAKDRRPL